jgi:subtilisin family serine protease
VRAAADAEVLLNELKQLGLENGKRYGDVISGMLPIAAVEEAVALERLRAISATPRPISRFGSITSQGDIALRADVARPFFGVDGTGVTVGVISDSYDVDSLAATDAATDIMSFDLPFPSGVTVIGVESPLCGTLIDCVDEGRAVAQIIHDIAPGAAILFSSGLDGKADYATKIIDLQLLGVDVIIDDLFYLNEPMFQDGVIAQAVDDVVALGVVYFSAAGNEGRQSYEAPFSGRIVSVAGCLRHVHTVGRNDARFRPGPGSGYLSKCDDTRGRVCEHRDGVGCTVWRPRCVKRSRYCAGQCHR